MFRKLLNPLSCCCVLLGMGVMAGTVGAQTQTDERIRLMSEALAARDVGDLARARENLVQLLELSPNDPGIQRLLENVELNMRQPEPAPAVAAGVDSPLVGVTEAEMARVRLGTEEAVAFQEQGNQLRRAGSFREGAESLIRARNTLPDAPANERRAQAIDEDLAELFLEWAQHQLQEGDLEGARTSLARYAEVGEETRRTRRTAQTLQREVESPRNVPIAEVSPEFPADQERIRQMLRTGRAQYLNGDIYGAEQSFRQVEAMDVYNAEAKVMLTRIAQDKRSRNHLDREKTRTQMLEEIGSAWQRPQIYVGRPPATDFAMEEHPLERRLDSIIIPSVNFAGVELSRAINTLSAISQEYDPTGQGVNIVPRDPEGIARPVHINVRDLSLRRILNLIVDDVGFQYEVEEDVIVVRPGARRRADLETENFPVSPATINRLIGRASPAPAGGQAQQQQNMLADDPFAPPTQAATPAPQAAGGGGESQQIRQFLQQAAGVDFNITGTNLIYDGSDVWVTQTPRNLERIRNVFRRLSDVRQVEIEARFLEVSEGAVNELGFNWQMQSPGGRVSYQTNNRNLAGAFAGAQITSATVITGPQVPGGSLTIPASPPSIPGTAALGAGAANFAVIDGISNGYDVRAVVRMLQQRTGADLLSAPKVTVLSGHQATINVAQEIRYPDSFGDTQSEVGRGGTGDGGAAGVTITPGTPQDFQMRRVGVELTVTPTVEQDNSVTLDLNPRVTEFEGFVEYGSPSIAVTANQTATVPPGFFQPIFATREVNTRVNIWDGATVVMGGLTREEVRRVSDRTPILGDIPILGRFFRSEGEGSQKRNLLIFVTANLVSPGGSPMRQQLRTVEPGALFQNPTIVTPSGAVAREKRIE